MAPGSHGQRVVPDELPSESPGELTVAPLAQEPQEPPEKDTFRPPRVESSDVDWIRLKSGEWLRGELSELSHDRVEFDSEVLKELQLDWEDVVEVITATPFTLLLDDRTDVVGVLRVRRDAVVVRTGDGERTFTRDQVVGFIRGRPTERNYWSGRARFGGTVRKGNTDQVDTAVAISATRRTASSRLSLSLDSVVGSLDGQENINNQTFRGSQDYFFSRRVYARPLGLELFRDRIQNIELRASPYSALGYLLVDEADTEWEVSGGLGYRYTRYESVGEGESSSDDLMTGVLASAYRRELSNTLDLELGYSAEVGLENAANTNQEAALQLTFDFVLDLKFDFRVLWKRVGRPEADAGGEVPDRDDLRLDLGVSWKF